MACRNLQLTLSVENAQINLVFQCYVILCAQQVYPIQTRQLPCDNPLYESVAIRGHESNQAAVDKSGLSTQHEAENLDMVITAFT